MLLSWPSGPAAMLFDNRAMRAVGKWSFSLYLLHWAILDAISRLWASTRLNLLLEFVIAVAASLATAWLAHRLIERPGQKLVKRTAGYLYIRILDRMGRRLSPALLADNATATRAERIARAD